jgi:hypothetical protein
MLQTGFSKRDFYNGIVVVSFSFFINGISRCLSGEKSSCVGFLYGKREIMNENTDEIFDETGSGTTRTGSAFTMSET